MKTLRAVALVASVAACLAACGSFASSSGEDAGDAGGVPESGSSSETSTTPSDAGVEAAAPSFCLRSAGDASFCADFDQNRLESAFGAGGVADEWTRIATGTGQISLDNTQGHSLPGSMRVSADQSDVNGDSLLLVAKLLPAIPSKIRIGYWLMVDEVGPSDANAPRVVALGGLEMGSGAIPYKAHMALYPPLPLTGCQLVIDEVNHVGGAAMFREVAKLSVSIKPMIWTHIDVLYVLSSTGKGTITVGTSTATQVGADAGTYDLQMDPLTRPTITAGLVSTGFASWRVHIDDYQVEVTP